MVAELASKKIDLLLQPKDQIGISISGPLENIKVRGIYERGFMFNDLAPAGARFTYAPYGYYGVTTDVKKSAIDIHPGDEKRSIFVYSLFHALGRLHLHSDKAYHNQSLQAHQQLDKALVSLQAYGKVVLPKPILDREDTLRAWSLVCQEEVESGKKAFQMMVQLRKEGFNPIPQIHTRRELERLINSTMLIRTARQILRVPPRQTEKFIGKTMALSPTEIAAILQG